MAVGADHEIAVEDGGGGAAPFDQRGAATGPGQGDVCGIPDDVDPARLGEVEQVAHDLLLAIDGDRLAGEGGHVDAEHLAVEREIGAAVKQALGRDACAGAELVHQRDGAGLEHAGTDAAFDIGAVAALDDSAGNPRLMEDMGEEHACRAGADDRYLGAHC